MAQTSLRPTSLRIVSSVADRPRTTVSRIHQARCNEVRDALLQLAQAAERGEVTGVAYVVITPTRATRLGWFGSAERDVSLIHHGVSRLASLLCWPEESQPL